ncbi:MAG: hypothetical protein JWO38_283 [Gemmataceae bacterium]|nr:hypothetical protein [Gemmataceae bacterium]
MSDREAPSSGCGPVVQLVRDGQILFAPALPVEVLRQFFTSRRAAIISETGFSTGRQLCRLFSVHRDHNEIRFPAGLVPAVLAACRTAGLSVRLNWSLQEMLPVVGPDGLDRRVRMIRTGAPLPPPVATSPRGPAVLDLVRRHDRGLVRYDPAAVDVAAVIAEIALAWPQMSVAVVCDRAAETRALRDRLRHLGLADTIASASRNRPCTGDAGRVIVATPVGLAGDGVDLAWRQIVIVVDALDALGEQARYCLDHALRARVYAMLPIDARPSPHEWDLLRMRFGFAELVVPAPGLIERPVTVEWESVRCGRGPDLGADILAVKRRGVWHNGQRNRLVAGIARRVATGSPDDGAAGAGTLVLVETVAHALALAGRLRGWSVVSSLPVIKDGLTASQMAAIGAGASPFSTAPFPAIVTFDGLARYDLAAVTAIVRADAGTGLPPLPPGRLGAEFPAPPLRLVDLDGDSHPLLRRAARQRRAAYVGRGWFAPGVDPVEGRAARFLGTRPRLKEGNK